MAGTEAEVWSGRAGAGLRSGRADVRPYREPLHWVDDWTLARAMALALPAFGWLPSLPIRGRLEVDGISVLNTNLFGT